MTVSHRFPATLSAAVALCVLAAGCQPRALDAPLDIASYCTPENAYRVARETGKPLKNICPVNGAEARAQGTVIGQEYRSLSRRIAIFEAQIEGEPRESLLDGTPEAVRSLLLRVQLQRLISRRDAIARWPI